MRRNVRRTYSVDEIYSDRAPDGQTANFPPCSTIAKWRTPWRFSSASSARLSQPPKQSQFS